MNTALLTASLMALSATSRWPLWLYPAVALSIFSLEVQAGTLVGGVASIGQLALVHAIVLAIIVSRRTSREALISRWMQLREGVARLPECLLGPRDRRLAAIVLVLVLGILSIRATLFVAEAADPYHLVRTSVISITHSLQHVPVEDWKINVLGYFYELLLADLSLGRHELAAWLGVQGPLLVVLYCAAVACVLVRAGVRVPWYAFLLGCVIPAVFHQGVLIKNDLFAALLGLPVLLILQRRESLAELQGCAAAGFMTGLAMSTKITMMPLALALGLFLPWTPRHTAVRTRLAAAAGLLCGIVAGGLVLVVALNVADYGTPGGPTGSTGNMNETPGAAAVSLLRFLISWFDASVVTRMLWPDRGGWGGAVGPPFIWAFVVLGLRAMRDGRARRALAITLVCLLPFGLIYPDADLTHRMALAPAVFAVLTALTIEARRGMFQSWTMSARAALVCALLALALIGRSSATYLRQAEYMRPRSVALAMEPTAGYLASQPAWQLREARGALGDARRVCTIMQENMLVLRGYSWAPAVVTVRSETGSQRVWRPDAIERCDALIVGPNHYPDPDDRSAAAIARCANGPVDVTGADVAIRSIPCESSPRP
jgi:hypothetical protein